jgi:hypothetical protein
VAHLEGQDVTARPVQLDLFDGRRRRGNKRRLKPEHEDQVAVIQWAMLHERQYPDLDLLHSVPNGGLLGGDNPAWIGKALKDEGKKAGVPDLDLPVPRGPYIGLRIEMKAKGRKSSADQLRWQRRLREVGHRVEVCVGWEAATKIIMEYLGYV